MYACNGFIRDFRVRTVEYINQGKGIKMLIIAKTRSAPTAIVVYATVLSFF